MTIPFGRRRLILTFAVTQTPHRPTDADILPGATDAELAHLASREVRDLDRARWEALSLIYGGVRR